MFRTASSTSVARISTLGAGAEDGRGIWQRPSRAQRSCRAMSEGNQPRRVRTERNIYRRVTGVYEVGFKDGAGKQRWRTVDGGITAARAVRDELLSRRARGEQVTNKSRLRFGDAADEWLNGPVLDLGPATQSCYRNAVEQHLVGRFGVRRLDTIGPDDLAELVRALRIEGLAESTIVIVVGVTNRIYRYAARRLGWAGANPVSLMLSSERPKPSKGKRRRIFERGELEQTISAAGEPYRTLFTVAALTGARLSELLALTWANLRVDDLDDAQIEFAHQVDQHGNLGPTKTEGSARTIPSHRSWHGFSPRTGRHRRSLARTASCSRRVRAARSVSPTSLGPCVLLRSKPSMTTVAPPSRSCTPWTSAGIRSRFRAECSRRCTASVTPSQAARCLLAKAWMRSPSCLDIAMPM